MVYGIPGQPGETWSQKEKKITLKIKKIYIFKEKTIFKGEREKEEEDTTEHGKMH